MILLIDNYDSFTYNVKQCVETLGYECEVVRNDEITVPKIRALRPRAVIISPGPGRPESAGVTLELIDALAAETPMLGICLGHQAIGQAMGGRVVRAPRAFHGKLSRVRHSGLGIFEGVERTLLVARYHSLIVERESLPDELEITAETEDGVIMGFRHRSLPVHGVQFHPESVATERGADLVANFLRNPG